MQYLCDYMSLGWVVVGVILLLFVKMALCRGVAESHLSYVCNAEEFTKLWLNGLSGVFSMKLSFILL